MSASGATHLPSALHLSSGLAEDLTGFPKPVRSLSVWSAEQRNKRKAYVPVFPLFR